MMNKNLRRGLELLMVVAAFAIAWPSVAQADDRSLPRKTLIVDNNMARGLGYYDTIYAWYRLDPNANWSAVVM